MNYIYIFVLKSSIIKLKIGILIPDRGDRPKFMENCIRMIKAQTLQPTIIEIVDDIPPPHFVVKEKPLMNDKLIPNTCDITWRYRTGYDRLRKKGLDAIFLWENDDWYAPNYLEIMCNEWEKRQRPDLLGHIYTIYYHIKLFGYFEMKHKTRSSAMNTLIKPDMHFNWCVDFDPYTDIHIWTQAGLNGQTFDPKKHITLGIKHGVGLCGGRNHINKLHRFKTKDTDHAFLKSIMDQDSFEFYTNYFNHA